MSQKSTHYSILNCDENATKDEIKKQYKKLVLNTHPDKRGSNVEEFHQMDRAVKVLDNDVTRRQYDCQLIEKRNDCQMIGEDLFLTDFTFNSQSDDYSHDCRCGGSYTVSKSHSQGMATQSYAIISCNCCSLCVRLKL